MDTKLKGFAVNLLRKGTFKWKPRGEAKKLFKVKVGEFSTGRAKYGYKCNDCEEVFMSKEVKMDHIRPVVDPIDGFQGFDTYIERMFCDVGNFQSMCSACHDDKTAWERDFKRRAKDLNANGESLDSLKKEYELFIKKYTEKL